MKKMLKEVAEFKYSLGMSKKGDQKVKVLTPGNLLEHNIIKEIVTEENLLEKILIKVLPEDILLKRINPLFINYIDRIEEDVYASANLIIIRAVTVDPKYLAYILNRKIKLFSESTGRLAISKKELGTMEIPILDEEKQKLIGDTWVKSVENFKLRERLNQLQLKEIDSTLDEMIF